MVYGRLERRNMGCSSLLLRIYSELENFPPPVSSDIRILLVALLRYTRSLWCLYNTAGVVIFDCHRGGSARLGTKF